MVFTRAAPEYALSIGDVYWSEISKGWIVHMYAPVSQGAQHTQENAILAKAVRPFMFKYEAFECPFTGDVHTMVRGTAIGHINHSTRSCTANPLMHLSVLEGKRKQMQPREVF